MLSPGKYHELVPKDPQENLRYRKWLLEECRKDSTIKKAVRAACRDDILFYTNSFVFQYNPDNLDHEVEPFITYDFQEQAMVGGDVETDAGTVHNWGILECIEDHEDARWPKSRKMGASWVALITTDWLCLFHKNKSIGVLSRDESSVDQSGDPNSLFWKIEFIHEHLPDWLKGKITKRKMRFNYERTNSYIVGEANTAKAFVSGRATMLIIDEFGQFNDGAATFEMTSDVSFCRIFVFTHKEQSGMAYDLCFDAKYTEMREIKTHWTQHPDRKKGLYRYNEDTGQIDVLDKLFSYPADFKFIYDIKPLGGPFPGIRSPWYDHECRRRSERDVSMNLDIDPRGATDKFFDSYRIHVIKTEFCMNPCWRGTLKHDARGMPIELIEETAGLIKLWIMPKSYTEIARIRSGGGVDIAAGTGATPSCLSIMNADTGEKVLEYSNAVIFAADFAVFCVAVCRMFKDHLGTTTYLGWEIQGGGVFDDKVRSLGYGPCYQRRQEDKLGRPTDPSGRRGINTSGQHIMPVMESYRDALYDRRCINRSDYGLDETLRFVYSGKWVEYRGSKKPKKIGEEGSMATVHHGDIVKADAIAYKMIKEMGYEQPKDVREISRNSPFDPRTFDGRVALAEKQMAQEEAWV